MYYFFQQQGARKHAIFPLVDCDHHATTALFEYRGSLAWLTIERKRKVQIDRFVHRPVGKYVGRPVGSQTRR